nr:hypothetical protein [Tanacetum cinerariifolium]
MYAGSTVITLTLVWGISIIFSKHKLKKGSSPDSSIKCLSLKCKLSFRTDTSVNIDNDTGRIAVIMLLSLIPFAFVGLVSFMSTPAMTLIALIVSGVSLLVYFGYQVGHPWIRVRSLEYLKQENVRMRFLDYVKKLSKQVKGDPDVECFRRAFDEADSNHDGAISQPELEDENGTINRTEFEQGCTNWLKWKNAANSSGSAFRNIWNQVIHKQRSNLTTIHQIMPTILKKVQKKHKIVKEDGEPDINEIQGLFSLIDKDKNGVIQKNDIKQFIETLHFGIKLDPDRVLDELVKEFDADNNKSVNKKEFEDRFRKWIGKAMNHDPEIQNPTKAIAKFEKVNY